MRLIAVLTSALMMLLTVTVQAGEAVPVPGTSWSIEPPPGFTLTRDPLTMFIHPSKAVVMVMQTPQAALKLSDLGEVGSVQGEGNNITRMDEMREVTIGGRHALFFKGHMLARNSDMMAAIIEGQGSNAMVIAAIPANAAAAVDKAAMEASLLTAIEVTQTMDQRAAALPYRFDDLAGMRIADVIVGSVAIVTDGPSNDMASTPDQPFAMVFVADAQGQSVLSAEGDGPTVRARITQEYPDAAFLGTIMRDMKQGRVLEVTYTRKDKETQKALAGIAWFRIDGSKAVMMIAQHPMSGFHYDRLLKVWDGLIVK
ncbi:hypothetical protein P6U16_05090 [Rhizobium sp. 32-5/1]|uniref:hypothetical protein n=1 Tax=Rhizobium sp. 32-5/1 TaxID=3019602 RepID=UPI00240DEBD5|nr:hypothetical protein [Rhizobium sp. 32-5/1]WEZ84085.1 hypothetical protein P6U16_05090 [Rhizobium sp. 32-5/1]